MQEKEQKLTTATVVSKSGDKSIKVGIVYKVKHPKYGKYVKRRTTFGVHDEHNSASVGDVVEVVQCRPMSKSKSWRLVKIVKQAVQQEG